MVFKTLAHPAHYRDTPLHLAQQHRVRIRRDLAAVESIGHLARIQPVKYQLPFATLRRHEIVPLLYDNCLITEHLSRRARSPSTPLGREVRVGPPASMPRHLHGDVDMETIRTGMPADVVLPVRRPS